MFNTINNLSFDNVEIKTRLNNTNENMQKLVERILVDEIEQKANHHRITKNTTHIRRNTKTLTRIDKDLENETLTNAPTAIIGNDTITFTETDLKTINENIILDNQEKFPINITIMETYNMDEDMLIKTRIDYKYYKISATTTPKDESITSPVATTTEETTTSEDGVIKLTTITTDSSGRTITTTTKTPTASYKYVFFLGKYDNDNRKMNITKLNFDNLTYSTFKNGTDGQYDTTPSLEIPEFAKNENNYAIIGFCVIDNIKYIMCYYSQVNSLGTEIEYYIIFYNVVDNRKDSTLTGLAISIPFGTVKYVSKSQYIYKKYLPVELTAKDASKYFIGILLEYPNVVNNGSDTYKRVLLRIAPNETNKFAYNPYTATIKDGSNNNITDLLHVQGHITQINKENYNIYYYAIINGKIYVMNNDFTKYTTDTAAKTITIIPTKTLFNNDEGNSIKTFSTFDNIKISNLIDYRYTDITTEDTLHYLVKGIIMVEYDSSAQIINYYYPTIKKNATTDTYEKYTINLANKNLSNIRTSDTLINISCNNSLFNTFDIGGTKYYYLTRENKELYLWNIKDFLFNNISDTYLWCDSNVDFFNAIIINSPSINKDASDQFVDISVSYVIHRCCPVDIIKSFKSDTSIMHINKIPNITTRERSSAKARSIRTLDLRKNKDTEEASEISKSYSSYSDDTTTTSTTSTKQKQEQQKQQQKQQPKQRGGFWRRRNNVEQSDNSEHSASRSASSSRRRFAKI